MSSWAHDTTHIACNEDPTFPWLIKPYILSQALKRACQKFDLNIIQQVFAQPYVDEQEIFPQKITRAFVREVFLTGDDVPRIYARVVIPEQTYRQYEQDFIHLGTKPLGETLLYDKDNISRSAFEYNCLPISHHLVQSIYTYLPSYIPQRNLLARRSIFWMNTDPLLVTELFLPSLPPYVD